jgi:hypothetical protein
METTAPLKTPEAIRTYIFAGCATFTVVSRRTGERKTFKLRAKEDARGTAYFASLLAGPDNTGDFQYLGFVYQNRRTGAWEVKLNKRGWAREACTALAWVLVNLSPGSSGEKLVEQAEVWHTGRCGRCGRELTVPESVASGIGPVCEGRAAA